MERHSLQKCRLCRFSLLFGDIDNPDIVPMDFDGLLSFGSSGNLLRLKHFDFLNERTDDFGGQFGDFRVAFYKGKERVDI